MIDAGFIFQNKLLDLFFECSRFFEVQAYFTLFFAGPYERAVECLGGKVGGKKGDRVEAECSCGVDCFTQMAVVGFLDSGPAGDRHGGVVMTDGGDAFVDEIVGSADAADGIVNLLGAVERDDDVIEESGDFFCSFLQEKACGEKGEVNLPFTKEIAQSGEIVVQQRFAAGENDVANAEIFERCAMTFQVLHSNLVVGFTLPDIAHDAAAVAAAVGVQDEDRQSREPRWRRWCRGSFMQRWHGQLFFRRYEYLALLFFWPRRAGCQWARVANADGRR